MVCVAVRAGGVVGIGVHRLPAVALDEGVGRYSLVVLAVRGFLYLVVALNADLYLRHLVLHTS